MAGVGKSSLVRNLYYDMMLQSNQFSEYIWVDVCHPFNLRGFSRSLILDFGSEKDPIQQCRQLLEHHRCLIVIDELNTKEEWDLIQSSLLCTYSTSVIIVITTEANIAAHCTKKKELMFNVQGLEDNAAFHLFEKEVSTKYELPSSWRFTQPWVEELIMKCGGLPRVIVEIANSLGTKSVGLDDSARSLSNNFMHDLETHQQFNNLRGLFSWMHSIILNPPDFLKPCIFYLSIFPPNRIIRRRRIVRRWIAEGYSKESVEINSNENAENFFSELVQMSIFQQVPGLDMTAFNDTRVSLYQVNGFIHEYMVSQQIMEENLVFQLGFRSIPTSQHRGRHLIIQEYWDRDRIVFEGIGLSRLRSLTVFGKWESFFISKSMKMLRVLDLEDASSLNYGDLENMVKTFHRLKFLSLRVHSEIHRLPSSLGDLRQLQTLDIRGTSIVTLPESFTKLHILQYIRAGSKLCSRRCRQGGVEVPGGIGILTALHTLGVVNVNASGGVAFLRELKRLTQLRKLGVYGINKNNCDEFFSSIKWHQYLESLSVQFDKGNQCRLDDISLTCWKLQSLKLYGLNDKLPKLERGRWQTGTSTELSELRKLDLEMTALNKDDIEFLAKQPRLSIMRLRVKQPSLQFYAELSGEEFPTYENVKILQITSSSSSLNVTFGSKTMGNLDLLKVDCSNGSTYEFSGLEHLPELKEVLVTIRSTLSSDEKETLKKKFESQLANHPKSPAVKLQERTILL
uniref:Uncharacterized protein n=1 Tax=Avena sativa TaxID=4498 RepID=A0ACD6ANV7_AVESA